MSEQPLHIEPAALRRLASLPHFGQAEAILRKLDPWWHFAGELRTYRVVFECEVDGTCPTCGCDCGEWSETEDEEVEVEARSPEEAEELATAIMAPRAGWYFVSVVKPKPRDVELPDDLRALEAVANIANQIRWLRIPERKHAA
jgi:hypothetical protein